MVNTLAWIRTLPVTVVVCFGVISARLLITRVDYDTNPDYVTMRVRINNESVGSTVDIEGTLFVDLTQGIFAGIEVETKVDGEFTSVAGTNKELCGEADMQLDPMVALLNEELHKFGNLTFMCPYHKGFYSVSRFHMPDDHMAVTMLPAGDYCLKMDLMHQPANETKKVLLFKLTIYTTLTPSGPSVE
ncbi:uncharacterized protein LOC131205591 [Anopheles bellator]|uniref:uncharacterized protein LOC131205591 n=1 Tax=Anopheles bellator TaxID=139047 RepID=UPI002648C0F6|nr:uncharacterized protein LOC131205591 [Anopheles bellator]